MNTPFVSVIIPCLNEEKFIASCIDTILAQDYPKECLEILFIDGRSTDKTVEIIKSYIAKYPFIKLLDNPYQFAPHALNIAIKASHGQVILRMDAHNFYKPIYISRCVHYLLEYDCDNVGGLFVTRSAVDTNTGHAIVLALTCSFGIGNADYRLGIKEPKYVDTVPFGCFKREVFDRIGYFDEDLIRAEDDEFNARLIKSGGKVLLVPDIISEYHARSTFKNLWRMFYQYGYFKPLAALKLKKIMTWRQLVPALFFTSLVVAGVLGLFIPVFKWLFIIEAGLYLSVNVVVSLFLALRNKVKFFPYLVITFSLIHFAYAFGYLQGIVDFIFLKNHIKNKMKHIGISR